jgi:hypothetical protein
MKRTWTIIGVGDVPGSFKWYQSLLGLPATAPAHDPSRKARTMSLSPLRNDGHCPWKQVSRRLPSASMS